MTPHTPYCRCEGQHNKGVDAAGLTTKQANAEVGWEF
jgi:hypothetical protein